jgi:hypothetical protein
MTSITVNRFPARKERFDNNGVYWVIAFAFIAVFAITLISRSTIESTLPNIAAAPMTNAVQNNYSVVPVNPALDINYNALRDKGTESNSAPSKR